MSERLTDEELKACQSLFGTHLGEPTAFVLVQRMIAELRERRATDLSYEEMNALAWLRSRPWLDSLSRTAHLGPPVQRALAALDKLLARRAP